MLFPPYLRLFPTLSPFTNFKLSSLSISLNRICDQSWRSMETSATPLIERQSSIDSEPRTLNMDQLQYAREAALYVAQTNSMEEALSIFTKGLKPVVSAAKEKKCLNMDSTEDCDSFATHLRLPAAVPTGIRDIVSAPF